MGIDDWLDSAALNKVSVYADLQALHTNSLEMSNEDYCQELLGRQFLWKYNIFIGLLL